MNILIIGSKGFIGSHALKYFRSNTYNNVYGCDVVVDYVDTQYYLVDATHPNYQEPFKEIEFDICINCSGAASVPDSLKHPARDFSLNTANVFYLLNSIKELCPNCKLINLSSAAVYGNPESLPIKENHLLKPVSPYGSHKFMAESICKEFYSYFNIATCSLRIFSAYGPGLKKQLLWDLYQKSKQSSIKLFGTGKETRDFIYIDDLIQAIDLIIKKGNFNGQVVNIANGKQISIKDIVKSFYSKLNTNIQYSFKGEIRKGDPINWEADITKLKKLGYTQKVTLEHGIEKYIKWIKGNELD